MCDVHALAQEQEIAEVELPADAGAGAPADDDRLDLGQVAFLVVGKAQVELFAGDQAEHGVAEEFQAFVGGEAGIGAGSVRQAGPEQIRLAKAVADGVLAFFQNLGLHGRG